MPAEISAVSPGRSGVPFDQFAAVLSPVPPSQVRVVIAALNPSQRI